MTRTDASTAWWRDHGAEYGAFAMFTKLQQDAEWSKVLRSGRQDLQKALDATAMPVGKELSVLEVGCGLGRVTFALAEHYGFVLGIDVSPDLIECAVKANTHPHVRFEVSNGLHLSPSEQRPWDIVFCFEVLHHVSRPILANYIRDSFRLLRPGGRLVMEVNVRRNPWTAYLARPVRRILHWCGKRTWRGYPTGPGFQRKHHPLPVIQRLLDEAGFELERTVTDEPKEAWVVAIKPEQPSGD